MLLHTMYRKRSGYGDGNASFVLPMIVGKAMAKHALTVLWSRWKRTRELLLLIARSHAGLRASRWISLTRVGVVQPLRSSRIRWSPSSI